MVWDGCGRWNLSGWGRGCVVDAGFCFLEESTYGSDDETIKVSLRSAVGK